MVGIIGKPNTGKSTFFNASTMNDVPTGNYPFTTIEPNIGIAYVRVNCVCKELQIKDNPKNSLCIDGNRMIPVKLIDVAGLVPRASEGRGLGNKFLDDLRQADVLIQVIDVSGKTDEEGRIIESGEHDPINDVNFVQEEFDKWMANIIKKDWDKIVRTSEGDNNKFLELLGQKMSGLSINKIQINQALERSKLKIKKPINWKHEDIETFTLFLRTTSKPSIIAGNKIDLLKNKNIINKCQENFDHFIVVAAEAELLLKKASENKMISYIQGDNTFQINVDAKLDIKQKAALDLVKNKVLNKWNSTGVQNVINYAFIKILKCVVVYTVENENQFSDKNGNVLPDAYLVREGTTSKDLAYLIHTDIGKSFLHAIDAKNSKQLSSDYILKNNDIIKIVAVKNKSK